MLVADLWSEFVNILGTLVSAVPYLLGYVLQIGRAHV